MKTALIIGICILLIGVMYGCIEENGQDDNKAPSCTLDASPLSGIAPLNITFTLSAYDPDDSIAEWSLDIDNDGVSEYSGTGNPSSTQKHTYDDPGIYTARLIVTDNRGRTNFTTMIINVSRSPLVQYSSMVSISPTLSYVSPGENVCINILVDSMGWNVRTAGFQLNYTSSLILRSFAYENLLGADVLQVGIPVEGAPSINYAVSRQSGNSPVMINGTLATICFTAPSTLDTYNLHLHDVTLIDGSGDIIPLVDITDGLVIVEGG